MNTNFFDNAINQRLMGLHTLYLAKVIKVKGLGGWHGWSHGTLLM